jgi:Arc/MetJ family transcription regulator
LTLDQTYRWTPLEYAYRGKRNRSLREILAEAPSDASLYSWYVTLHGWEPVTVFDQSVIKQDDDLRTANKQATGHKGKLLTVAFALAAQDAPETMCVVVDRDFDALAGAPTSHAICTDPSSVETFSLDEVSLGALLGKKFARGRRVAATDVLSRIIEPLIWIAACRRYLATLTPAVGLSEDWLARVSITPAGAVQIADAELMGQALRAAGLPHHREAVESANEAVVALAAAREEPPHQYIRGHDFSALLLKLWQSKYSRSTWKIDLRGYTLDVFEGDLRNGLDSQMLNGRQPFVDLSRRFGSLPD